MVMVVPRIDGEVSGGEYDADISGVSVHLMHDSSFRYFAEKGDLDLAFRNFDNSSKFPGNARLWMLSMNT